QHHASLTAEIEQRINGSHDDDVYVCDVAELVDERADPRRWGAKHFNYIEISDIDAQTCVVYSNSIEISATPSRARKLVKSGDVFLPVTRQDLARLEEQAVHIADAEQRVLQMREPFIRAIAQAGETWRQMSLMTGSKPRPMSRTTSRPRSRTSDSDSHDRDIF